MNARKTFTSVLAAAAWVGSLVLTANSYGGDEGPVSAVDALSRSTTSGSAITKPAPAATNAVASFKLRANLQVDGEGIFLSQILEPGSDAPHLRLCDSPAFGKLITLKRPDIITLSSSAGFDSALTNWTGPDMIRISRRVRALAEKELLELITASLQQHYVKDLGQLELHAARPWSPVSVPDEPFTIQISDLPTSGVSSAFIVRFDLQTAWREQLGSWQLPLQAKVWREVWVARSDVKRSESVHGADLVRERRDMLLFHEPFAELSSDDSSLEFVESLQPGAPLLARLVKPRSIVHRGQSLAAIVRDGALMITLKVEALEDGSAGQLIRVRNPLSRRDLHAKVVDEANVQVSL